MTAWLSTQYELLRGLHIISAIAWMAGLLYLPRLYAYHTRAAAGSEMAATFAVMEAKLLRIIMNPAMAATWVLGLSLIWIGGHARGWGFLLQPWMLVKLAGVIFVTGWHRYLALERQPLERGERRRSERFWRMTNELPFLAVIAIVVAVTTEFGA